MGRGLFSKKRKHWFVERTSMIAHIYPSVLQAVSGRGYTGWLEGCFQAYRGGAMQDLGYELPRIPIPRRWVNKGKREGWGKRPRPSRQSYDVSAGSALVGSQSSLGPSLSLGPSSSACWPTML
jgi:hypothetical protein